MSNKQSKANLISELNELDLERLPEDKRKMVDMYIAGYSTTEIAEIMGANNTRGGVTRSNVLAHIKRSLKYKDPAYGLPYKEDLTNREYGFWKVLGFYSYNEKGHTNMWLCRCICGTEKPVVQNSLKTNDSTNCGCIWKQKVQIGKKYTRLKVIADAGFHPKHGHKMCTCICDCKTVKDYAVSALENGYTQSCGCLQKERVAEANRLNKTGKYKD